MGRETVAIVHWRGETAETKVLLEASELILRGGIRDHIPKSAIADARKSEQGLALTADGAPLLIEMTASDTERWLKALATPPPSLTTKLNIGPENPAYVLGAVNDSILSVSLNGATTGKLGDAATIIAVLRNFTDLEAAFNLAQTHPRLPLWCVYGKGPKAEIGESAVRAYLRSRGYIDTKVSSVSPSLTATRYRQPGQRSKEVFLF
jgi:hypothetical protein